MPRNYRQFCALARALDVVGERWTLLIVRELLLGPRRYGQLLHALPGIGTNLLADRLEAMQAEGLCSRDGRRYELTARGRALEGAVLALARWGMDTMSAPAEEDRMRPDWYAVAMSAAYDPPPGPRPDEDYEFAIDGEVFHLSVRGGRANARRGPAESPAFRMRAELETFLALATRSIPLSRADLDGDRGAARRWLEAFALPQPVRQPRRAARAHRASR